MSFSSLGFRALGLESSSPSVGNMSLFGLGIIEKSFGFRSRKWILLKSVDTVPPSEVRSHCLAQHFGAQNWDHSF